MNKKYEYNGNIYCEDDLSEYEILPNLWASSRLER